MKELVSKSKWGENDGRTHLILKNSLQMLSHPYTDEPPHITYKHTERHRGRNKRQRDSITAYACIVQLVPLLRHSIQEEGEREDAKWRS